MRLTTIAIGIVLLVAALVAAFVNRSWAWLVAIIAVAVLAAFVAEGVRRVPATQAALVQRWDGNVLVRHGPLVWVFPGWSTFLGTYSENMQVANVSVTVRTADQIPITVDTTVFYTINLTHVGRDIQILVAGWPPAAWRSTVQQNLESIIRDVIYQSHLTPPDYVCDRAALSLDLKWRLETILKPLGIKIGRVRLGEVGPNEAWRDQITRLKVTRERLETIQQAMPADSKATSDLARLLVVLGSADGNQPFSLTHLLAAGMIGQDQVSPALLHLLSQMVANGGSGGGNNGAGSGNAPAAATSGSAQPAAAGARPAPAAPPTPQAAPTPSGATPNGSRPAASVAPQGGNGATAPTAPQASPAASLNGHGGGGPITP